MRDYIVFYINGKRTTIADEAALVSLADLLRDRLRCVGTKVVCNEGDCGACSVLVGRPSEDGQTLIYQTIDACIAFPFQLDRTHVVTVEGLTIAGQLSPVQEAMVRCHGSQCGFCTPGFVIALHGMLEAGMEFTDSGLRYALSGNLCRCTGYVSILQAGQAIDPCKLPRLKLLYPEQVMLEEFKTLESDSVRLSTRDGIVFIPRTLEHAIELRAEHPEATVVSGATDYGVSRNHRKVLAGQTLCLSNVRGFSEVSIHDHILSIGGGATWCAIEQFVKHRVPEYHAILQRFGSPQIRNVGTLAGNLANGSPIADALPFHFVSQAVIELRSVRGTRRVSIEDFYEGYRQSVLANDELITVVETPLPRANERIKLYKISKRRDMDISSVTFGLWLKLEGDVIQEVRLALGGVGPTVQRLLEVESSLVGRNIDEESFRQAGRVARRAISPWTDVRGSAEYRSQLVENLMLKSFYDLQSPDRQ